MKTKRKHRSSSKPADKKVHPEKSPEGTDLRRKSQEMAQIIGFVKDMMTAFDVVHARQVLSDMRVQVHNEGSLAALNPYYKPIHTEILMENSNALEYLIRFRESLDGIAKLNARLDANRKHQKEIQNMFT